MAFAAPLLTISAFVDGYNLIVAAPLLLLYRSLGVSLPGDLQTLFPVAAILGSLVGGLLLGHLGDLWGRRRTFLWDLGFFVAIPIACALAPSLVFLIVLRVVLGVGIGGNYPLASVLLAEESDPGRRGRRVALLGIGWTLGALSTFLLGTLLFPLGALAPPILLAAATIPAAAVMLLRYRLHESELWKQVVGSRSLRERRNGASLRALFRRGQAARTSYASVFWFLFDVVQYGVSLLLPLLLVAFGHATGRLALGLSALLYGGELAGTIGGAFLVDRVGRRPLQLVGFAAMTAGLSAAFFLPGSLLTGPFLLGTLLLLVTLGVGVGPGILEFVYPPELHPTEMRATGSGLALSASRSGAFIGVVLFPALAGWLAGFPGGYAGETERLLFGLYALIALLTLLVTLRWAPETRGTALTAPPAPLSPGPLPR